MLGKMAPFLEMGLIAYGGMLVQGLQAGDPQLIGPYRVVRRLGSGGMGHVFLGRSPGGRLLAIKVIRAELAGDLEFRTRFQREVAAARSVSGLFTAPVVDADLGAQVPWLATAYIAGSSLAETVTRHGPLPAASVLALAAGLAEGPLDQQAAELLHGGPHRRGAHQQRHGAERQHRQPRLHHVLRVQVVPAPASVTSRPAGPSREPSRGYGRLVPGPMSTAPRRRRGRPSR